MIYKQSIFNNWYNFNSKRYLYNSLSGYFGIVDDEMYNAIKNIEKEDINNKKFELLISKRIIVNKDLNEEIQIKTLEKDEIYNKFSTSRSFVISTTRNCNYKCKYCFESEKNNLVDMDEKTQQQTIEFIKKSLKNNTNCKNLNITWFGGEPLLNKQCIISISKELIKYCENNKIKYSASIITNASLIDDKFASLLQDLRINSVQITFDGNEKEYCEYKQTTLHNYNKAKEAIFLTLKNAKVNLRLNTDFKNYESIKKFVSQLVPEIQKNNLENKITFYLAPIDNENTKYMYSKQFVECNNDFLEFLYNNGLYSSIKNALHQPRIIPCESLRRGNYVIDSNGNLHKCEHYIGNDNVSIGNVKDGSYYSINEKKFLDYTAKCERCSVYPICHGGCMQKTIDKNIKMDCENFKLDLKNKLYWYTKIRSMEA